MVDEIECSEDDSAFEMVDEVVCSENDSQCEKHDFVNAEDQTNKLEIKEPVVGMTFKDVDEMFDYYKDYAYKMGFPVTRRTSKKGKNGEVKHVTFTCAREGKSNSCSSNPLKPRPTKKNECRARLGGSLREDGRWRVTSFKSNHSHEMSPSKSKFFKCNRALTSSAKRRLETNYMAGIRTNKSFSSFVVEAGGYENLPFLEKDCRNYIDKIRLLKLGEGDAVAIQNYFLKMQAENSNFFFSIDLDENGRLRNVFWEDSRSRAAYREFGEVVTFDTTYLVNKYDMPFAPFVGVNHHGQSTLLGCGLISSEDTETFTWLFKTWLTCMSEIASNGIITDQDKAMKKAIEIVLPNTRHRWCLWHIMKKVSEKLRSYKQYKSISYDLHNLVYDSQYPKEFEEGWPSMIERYALHENEWLSGLFSERHRWGPCFVKNSFWAGMSTTQRSESINAFFDGYVNTKTSLKQFVEQYDNALANKVEKEKLEDTRSSNTRIPCATTYEEMEKQAQEIYTIAKFKEFQEELTGKMYCEFISFKEDLSMFEYDIREDISIGEGKKRVTYKVSLDRDATEVKCSCMRFEFRGILCRHAIAVLLRNDILKIPDKYIKRMWRRDVRRCHTRVKVNYNGYTALTDQFIYEKMCDAFAELADLTADHEKRRDKILSWIENEKREVLEERIEHFNDRDGQPKIVQEILDPIPTRGKGRPPSKRKESKIVKKRTKNPKKTQTQKNIKPLF